MAPGPGSIEPIPGTPAAVVDTGDADDGDATGTETNTRNGERALVVADYHAGLEAGLRREGVSLPNHATERRERLCTALDDTGVERVVFLGDLAHSIGDPGEEERAELEALFRAVAEEVPVVVVKGNHDGGIERVVERADIDGVSVTPTEGVRLGAVGFAHGHTWPAPEVVRTPVLCTAHEHPAVRLTDSVGGRRVERVWLRGDLDSAPFDAHDRDADDTGANGTVAFESEASDSVGPEGERTDRDADEERGCDGERRTSTIDGELVVFPAFNDLVGGTWVNVPEQDFLSPFLPDGLANGEAYLLDGTRLGDYRRV